MILDGRTIVEKKIISFPDDLYNTDEQIQPNGVDLRLNKVYEAVGSAGVPTDGKVIHDFRVAEVKPKQGWWSLMPGGIYLADFRESANIRAGYVGQIISRSSLVRSGVDVMCGLWDSGWNGVLGCTLRVHNPVKMQYNCRIAQIIISESKFNGHLYSGRYQGANSQTALET